jgi:hypothetical protein
MKSVLTYVFQVVMLAGDANALLRVYHTTMIRSFLPQEYGFELVHTGVGKDEGRIVLRNQGSAADERVSLPLEKFDELLSYFVGGHYLVIGELVNSD